MLIFLHKLKNNDISKIFKKSIKKPKRKYQENFSKNGYTSFSLRNTKYCILVRETKLCNLKEKKVDSYSVCSKKYKIKFIESKN